MCNVQTTTALPLWARLALLLLLLIHVERLLYSGVSECLDAGGGWCGCTAMAARRRQAGRRTGEVSNSAGVTYAFASEAKWVLSRSAWDQLPKKCAEWECRD